jgi:hypothetical protein
MILTVLGYILAPLLALFLWAVVAGAVDVIRHPKQYLEQRRRDYEFERRARRP